MPRRGLALTALLVPSALALLSVTSVNVALPAIRDDLAAGPVGQALVLTAYALAYAVILLPAGRLGDRFGHKRVFLVGAITFTLSTLWCGVAPDVTQLVIARTLAGVSAGLTLTPVTALIQLLYRHHERARPFGIMGAVFGAATAVGPLMGGLLIQLGGSAGWRLVFLALVPIALAAALLAHFVIPHVTPRSPRGSDPLGTALFSLGVIGLILPFSLGDRLQAPGVALLSGGAVALVLFFLWVRHRHRQGVFAIVPMRLLRQPALLIGIAVSFFGFAGFTSAFLQLALLWQDALGHGPLAAGLLVLPFALGTVGGASITGPLTGRFGTRVVTAGLTMITGGLVAVAILIGLLPADAITFGTLLIPLLVVGIGVGFYVGPNTNASFAQTERADAGVASALVTAAQRCGTAVGIGMLSAAYVVLPNGPQDLGTQTAAASVTAALSGMALLIMLVSRRSSMSFQGMPGHDSR